MELEISKSYQGFTLLEKNELKELNSEGYLFLHNQSGARLYYIKNDDDNKVFSISFRTPPKDSTGVAHILEHSVLCGSRKFRSKEPFVELIKGSLNTFLNAMTFPDKTMYPLASRNTKDFYNLMDVYLDAVFHPNIYHVPEIFMQEGWHYELEDRDAKLTYKGVVYNEMKGAFSSPEGVLFRRIQESLFPDTAYGVESGGDPNHITDLTEEGFLEFHRKYYHPSNSYIYLYGDLDISNTLSFINDGYLKNYQVSITDSSIGIQKPFKELKRLEYDYPISVNEKEEDKTFLSLNFVAGKSTEPESCIALELLEHILLETPSSPLKKALIEGNIGKDVFGSFDDSILQPVFNIVVKNSNIEKIDKFLKITESTLKDLMKNGIDKKLIEAAINIKEFNLREADFRSYPKGLVYNIKIMNSWLYDASPKLHLLYDDILNRIKLKINSNYFEDLINSTLLENHHSSLVVIKPNKGMAERNTEKLRLKLDEYRKNLSLSEVDTLILQTKNLKKRQSETDSPEALSTIPILELKDIDVEVDELPLIEEEVDGIKVLQHNIFTNDIIYFNMYFDARVIEEEDIPYLALLLGILGKVSTENYSYEEMSNEINIYTGGIEFGTRIYSFKGSCEDFLPKVIIKSKALYDKFPKVISYIHEILNTSKFNDKKRIKEIIQEIKSRLEMIILQNGHILAANHTTSYFSSQGRFEDLSRGLGYYKFIEKLEINFESEFEDIISKLNKLTKKVFGRKNLLLSITGKDMKLDKIKSTIDVLINSLSDNDPVYNTLSIVEKPLNEGLMASINVQYVAKAYNFKKLGYKYNGSLKVLKTICNYNYLWNNVRVKGGAYGCSSSFQRNGVMFLTSYRDPNLKETLDIYGKLSEYIRNFTTDEREMTKYIIGTISDIDSPMTSSMKGEEATGRYISGLSNEDIKKERKEVLGTTIDGIRSFSTLISDCLEKNYLCVLGNEEKIKANSDIFETTYNIFE